MVGWTGFPGFCGRVFCLTEGLADVMALLLDR
jgi:hypothetical protein